MIVALLYIGLAIIPFFTIPGMDSRLPKEYLSLFIALSITLVSLNRIDFKKFKNYWVFLFIMSGFISILLAPHTIKYFMAKIQGTGISVDTTYDISNLWMFKAMFYILVYALMAVAIASIEFEREHSSMFINIISIAGTLMSLYVIIQAIGNLDQFFHIASPQDNIHVTRVPKALLGGTMGQPTVVSPFIALTVPISLYLNKYIRFSICALAIWLTASKVAMVAMLVGVVFYLFTSKQKLMAVLVIAISLCGITNFMERKAIFYPSKITAYLQDQTSGRWPIWVGAVERLKSERRFITGLGPSSFAHTITKERKGFVQAHCESLEVLLGWGLFGLSMTVMAYYSMVRHVFSSNNAATMAMFASIVTITVASFGTFTFQIAPNIFYSCALIGLIYNNHLLTRRDNDNGAETNV